MEELLWVLDYQTFLFFEVDMRLDLECERKQKWKKMQKTGESRKTLFKVGDNDTKEKMAILKFLLI